MLKRFILLIGLCFLLAGCAGRINQEPALPDELEDLADFTNVIGEPFASFGLPNDPKLTTQTVPVTGQRFTKAWSFTTTGPFETPYALQTGATNVTPIAKNDVLAVRFWARAVGTSQTAQTEFVLEEGGPNYAKSVSVGAVAGRTWKVFIVPFLAHRDFAPGEASILFRLGYANQSLELGGVRVLNFQKTTAVTSIPSKGFEYLGIEANAPWRTSANARIDQNRKGNLSVKVVDSSGNAVSGATIKVDMQRHAFPFGSAVDANRLFSDQTYQNNVVKLFNTVVLENDLKWPNWESYSRNVSLQALDFFASKSISVRGHNLIWPTEGDFILPDDVRTLVQQGNTTAVRGRIDDHFVDILGATKGKIVEWDVINEPSASKFVTNLLGEDELAVWLRRAKQLDPNAKLFINDYGNLGEGTLDVEYKRILQRMKTLGAPLEGIGLQGHFSWDLTPPEELHTRLNAFGALGLPLAITEFDVNITDEKLQAAYLRDALTVAFANPNVNSFLMWGFWEGQHWLPQAALYRQNWSIKPNGQVWNDLIFKQWWTNATGTTNTTGGYSTRGFLGRYIVAASKDGKTVSQTLNLAKAGSSVTLTLR